MTTFIGWLVYDSSGPNAAYDLHGWRYVIYKTRREARQNTYADSKVKKVVIKDTSSKEREQYGDRNKA